MLVLKILFAVLLVCLFSLMLITYAQLYSPKGALNPEDPDVFQSNFRDYAIYPNFFVDHLNGILIIIAGFVSGYLVVRKHTFGLPILYLVVLVPAIISLNSQFFPYVAYFLPSRSIIICSVLSWPLVLSCIRSVTSKAANNSKRRTVPVGAKVRRGKPLSLVRMLAVGTLLVLLIPSLFGYVTFETTRHWGWFTYTSWFLEDMPALEWIHSNVSPADLILNDGSLISRFVTSLSPKNLTYSRLTLRSYINRVRADSLVDVWLQPTNIVKVISLLREWNVRYILSTSEWGFSSGPEISEGFYGVKPFRPKTYAMLFDTYPFLTVVFSQGWTRVYEVTNLNVTFQTISILAEDGWAEGKLLIPNAWGENGTIGVPILSDDTIENTSRPLWLRDDKNLLGLRIPEGDYRFWGIRYKPQAFRNWTSADFLTFWVLSSSSRGLSVIIKDVMGNRIRYDFITESGVWQQIYVPLNAPTEQGPIDFTAIDAIHIVTGYTPPLAKAGDTLLLYQLNIIYNTTTQD